MIADRLIVGLIVCAAAFYLLTLLRAKKKSDCCGNQLNGKPRVQSDRIQRVHKQG